MGTGGAQTVGVGPVAAGAARHLGTGLPEAATEEWAENRHVDGDDTDDGLTNAPSVDGQRGRVGGERGDDADDGGADDENTRGK